MGVIAPLLRAIPFRDTVLFHEPALSVLTARHQADLAATAVRIRMLDPAEVTDAIAWHAHTLYFENAPLFEVAEELGRYTKLHLVISGAHLRELPVAGTFQASPHGVRTFLAMLNQGLGLTVHREAGNVVIQPADVTAH